MKRIYLLFSLIIMLSFAAKAQITLTQSNAPTTGNVVVTYSDTNYVGKSVGSAGANQTWNFTSWANNVQTVDQLVNPTTLSGYSNFPTANLGILHQDGSEAYLKSSSTDFNTLGAYVDYTGNADFIPLKYNPYEENLSFPSTYNTTFSGTYNYSSSVAYALYPPFDSARLTATVAYTSIIDGWGTVSTPSHSNVNCLRQKIRKVTNQSMYIHYITWILYTNTKDTTYDYNWWSDSYNYMVAQMQTDSAGGVTSASWLYQYSPLGITENIKAKQELKLYPNPASNQTTISFSPMNEEGELQVYNMLGQIVYNEKIAKGSSFSELNIQNYKAGLYKVLIKEKGILIGQGSLIKN